MAEDVAPGRAERYAEARRRQPAWLGSRWFQVLSVLLAVYWTYLLVIDAAAGSWRQVLVSGFFVVITVSTVLRGRRNRASADR